MMGRLLTSVFMLTVALLLVEQPAYAFSDDVVYVNKSASPPRDGKSCASGLATVQEGIDKAKAEKKKLVVVCDKSTYQENIVMADGIDVVSESISALGVGFAASDLLALCQDRPSLPDQLLLPTIVPAASGVPVVRFSGLQKKTMIMGFRIRFGSADTGAGILVDNCKHAQIIGNCIEHNTAGTLGGGVGGGGGNNKVLIDRNVIHDNSSASDGGGVGFVESNHVTLKGNLIEGNSCVRFGGGFAVHHAGHVEVLGGTVENNESTDESGGGGGASLQDDKKYTAKDNPKFKGNKSKGPGGAKSLTDMKQQVEFENVEVLDNATTSRCGGGGVNFASCPNVSITNSTFRRNKAATGLTDTASAFERFTASPSGGAIRMASSTVRMLGGEIHDNESNWDGGGVMVIGSILNTTGVLEGSKSELTLENVKITENRAAQDGGGLSATVDAEVKIRGTTTIVSNKALKGKGGGIHATCVAQVTIEGPDDGNIVIENNEAVEGPGGGMFLRNAQAVISRTIFRGNIAKKEGGAIWMKTVDDTIQIEILVKLFTLTFCNGMDGGLTLQNSLIENNQSGEEGSALAILRDKGVRKIIFKIGTELDPNKDFPADKLVVFKGNASSDPEQKSVITLRLGDRPVGGANFINACHFSNPGTQIHSLQEDVFKTQYWACIGNSFVDLDADDSIGIRARRDFIGAEGCVFRSETKKKKGIGIHILDSKQGSVFPRIGGGALDSRFEGLATGVEADTNEDVGVDGSKFEENKVGILFKKSGGTITENTFTKNDIAIRLVDSSPTISKNTGTGNGQAIVKEGNSNPTEQNNSIQ